MHLGSFIVTSPEVIEHESLVERFARRFDGVRGAEFDDLAQEGRIAVWYVLSLRWPESTEWMEDAVRDRCLAWIRHVSREGMGGFDESLPDD